MNLYDLSNRFWQENEYRSFSISATALYFFLLHRANMRRWQMPFRCPTEVIRMQLKTTRQNVVKAREELQKRGFISFGPGTDKKNPPSYTITDCTSQLSVGLSDELSVQLSHQMSGQLSDELSVGLSHQLSPYNIKDKDIEKDQYHNKEEEGLMDMESIETVLRSDSEWQKTIMSRLQVNASNIYEYLNTFFVYQKKKGIRRRDMEEVKNHFYNWTRKQINNNQYGNTESKKLRRGTEVPDASAEDYEWPI